MSDQPKNVLTKNTPIGLGLAAGVVIGVASWASKTAVTNVQLENRIAVLETRETWTREQMRALMRLAELQNPQWIAPSVDDVPKE